MPSTPFSDAGNAIFPPADARLDTVRPRDEAALRESLRAANAAGTPVTFAAALTGLTGSAVPLESGLRVDMTALESLPDRAGFRRVAPFLLLSETDPHRGVVAPGISLQVLNEALRGLELWYPPHPGELRATIGGNVATNASGPRTFAFGATREYVESLRVVLADGDVLELRRGRERVVEGRFSVRAESGREWRGSVPDYVLPAIKNAAGLFTAPGMDLIDLFVGSEGILGAVSEIGLRFLPHRAIRPEIFFFASTAQALEFADGLRPLKADAGLYPEREGDGILALEFFDAGSLALVPRSGPGTSAIPVAARAAIEVETFADDPRTRVKVLQLAERLGCLGTVPPEGAEAFRYSVPRRVAELLRERGQPKFGTDFAVPVSSFRELFAFYEAMDAEFGQRAGDTGAPPRTAKWGHIGDCHLHCNFLCENAEDQARAKAIYLKLVRKAVALGGTISAEHGVGKKTLADEQGVMRHYLWYMLGDDYLKIAEVKKVFDPKGILNRGNMVSVESIAA
jgi:D-lactate dehydrogenase (cytochrome)